MAPFLTCTHRVTPDASSISIRSYSSCNVQTELQSSGLHHLLEICPRILHELHKHLRENLCVRQHGGGATRALDGGSDRLSSLLGGAVKVGESDGRHHHQRVDAIYVVSIICKVALVNLR